MEPKDLSRLSPNDAVERMLRECGGILINIIRDADAAKRLGKEEDEILTDFCLYLLERHAAPLYLWQGRCKITTWTALIFRRWQRDRLRSADRVRIAQGVPDDFRAPGDDIGDTIRKDEVTNELEQCIQALPEMQREVIREKMYREPNLDRLGKKYELGKKIYPFIHKIYTQLKDCLEKKHIQFENI